MPRDQVPKSQGKLSPGKHQSEPDDDVRVTPRVPTPGRRSNTVGRMEPRPAAEDPQRAVRGACWISLRATLVVVLIIPIRHPFPHIAVHVVQTETIRCKSTYRGCFLVIPFAPTTVAIGPVAANRISPTVLRCAPRPRRILPLMRKVVSII